MFVANTYGGYNSHGEQVAHGLFLLLFNSPEFMTGDRELRAVIRHARLRQCGHFMMGSCQVGPARITLSGAYGSDGLPGDPPAGLWERLHPVPEELCQAYWSGSSHNDAGPAGPSLRAWARANLNRLRELLPDPEPPPARPRLRNYVVTSEGPGYRLYTESKQAYDPEVPYFTRTTVQATSRAGAREAARLTGVTTRIVWVKEGRG
jgi:hypothetical protein